MARRYLSTVCAVIGTGWVLISCARQPALLVQGLRSPNTSVTQVGPDAAVIVLAGSLLWLIALWAAFAFSAAALSLLPGRFGRLAHTVAEGVTPAVLRRVIGAAAGTSILFSPATAVASPADSSPSVPASAAASPVRPQTALSLPMDRAAGQSSAGAPTAPTAPATMPALEWPTDPDRSGSGHRPAPSAPKPQPKPAETKTAETTPAEPRPAGSQYRVRVRPGDSLWSITAHRLGAGASAARIQAEWPRWHAANRQLIGADPDLLRPGMELLVPRPVSLDSDR